MAADHLGRDNLQYSDQACHGLQHQKDFYQLTFHTTRHQVPTNQQRNLQTITTKQ